MEDILREFVIEAMELATNVEEHLLHLERQPDDKDILNALFRSFHTIKGGAGFMHLKPMVDACHLTENLFEALRTGQSPVTPCAIEAALQASNFVADQLQALASGQDPASLPALSDNLKKNLMQAIQARACISVEHPGPSQSNDEASVNFEPDWLALYRTVVPDAALTQELLSLGSATIPPLAMDGLDISASSVQAATSVPASALKEDSIRVDSAKLDVLLEFAGESVQATSQASALLEKLGQFSFEGPAAVLMAALEETLARATHYSTELQRATLATRMQPVGRLFQRFPRLVRELARELDKNVDLMIEGGTTEVDRVVVDSLYDPLVHMLRNSLDHGVESRAHRAAIGKPETARITLKAWQEGGSVMIEVRDDGKGMDADALRTRALSRGLIHAAPPLTDLEALQLIFLPGFSTKEVADSVSGRGVGMDVVKTAVERHRGSIRIDSQLGEGTRFSIRLPIELSILPTLIVRAAGIALALPLAIVERVVKLPENLDTVAGARVMRDQGRPLAVQSLANTLGYTSDNEEIGIIIAAHTPYILTVGQIEGTADLVVKPLTALTALGITGTARSAEGELVLVVSQGFLLEPALHIRPAPAVPETALLLPAS